MTNPRRLPRGAHLLMYSSPILLLVMVITLPSATTTRVAQPPENVAHVVTTTTAGPTTTTVQVHSATTNQPTTTSNPTAPVHAVAPAPKRSSAITTDLTAKTNDETSSVGVANSDVEGLVSPASPVAVIPLQGPGLWTMTTSSPSLDELICARTTRRVGDFLSLLTDQACQLQITSVSTGASLTWLLTPAP